MKILFLCNLVPYKWGAFESFLQALSASLEEEGGSLSVLFADEPSDLAAERFRNAHLAWHVVKGWGSLGRPVQPWRVFWAGFKLILRDKPDLVAVHFGNEMPTLGMLAAARLASAKKIRWVWHQRQQIADPDSLSQRRLSRIRMLSIGADQLIALYEGGRQSFLKRGVPAAKTSAILNGVEPFVRAREAGWLRRELGLAATGPLVVNVSSLIPRKRVDLTIQAFAACWRKVGTAHLLLLGAGADDETLRRMAAELGIADRVHFMGQRDDVRTVLSECDLLMLTSTAEACPLALIEAMSVGVPCLATAAGAANELIEDGVSGFVIPIGDVEGLKDRLGVLLGDDNLRRAMGVQSRRRWEEHFQLSRMVREHLECYRRVVECL